MSSAGSPPASGGAKRKRAGKSAAAGPSKRARGAQSRAGSGSPAPPPDSPATGSVYSPDDNRGFSPASFGAATPSGAPTPGASRSRREKTEAEELEEDEADLLDELEEGGEMGQEQREKDAMNRRLIGHFNEEQLDRYGEYRRAGLSKKNVKRLVNTVLQQTVGDNVIMSVRGIAKVFVGEIVEEARRVQASKGEVGPLEPDHLMEAYRLWRRRDVPANAVTKRFVR